MQTYLRKMAWLSLFLLEILLIIVERSEEGLEQDWSDELHLLSPLLCISLGQSVLTEWCGWSGLVSNTSHLHGSRPQ